MSNPDYELVAPDHKLLLTELPRFDFDNTPTDPIILRDKMILAMYRHGGIGLSCNQVGLPYRMFVMRGPDVACFNPELIWVSDEQSYMEEGCLSFPLLNIKIKRPDRIKCRFQTETGEFVEEEYSGLTARCFQHEMDHMQGSNFITRANVYHREQAFKRLAKAVRNKQVAEMMMQKNKQNFVVQPKRSFQNDEFVYTT